MYVYIYMYYNAFGWPGSTHPHSGLKMELRNETQAAVVATPYSYIQNG